MGGALSLPKAVLSTIIDLVVLKVLSQASIYDFF